jgi:hypothetical protein
MASNVKVTINKAEVAKRTRKGLQSVAIDLGKALDKAITTADWEYPFQPSPRDIVLTGALLKSRKTIFSGTGCSFVWDVAYAMAIHEGVTLKNGTRLPARRWTEKAEKNVDLPKAFKKGF